MNQALTTTTGNTNTTTTTKTSTNTLHIQTSGNTQYMQRNSLESTSTEVSYLCQGTQSEMERENQKILSFSGNEEEPPTPPSTPDLSKKVGQLQNGGESENEQEHELEGDKNIQTSEIGSHDVGPDKDSILCLGDDLRKHFPKAVENEGQHEHEYDNENDNDNDNENQNAHESEHEHDEHGNESGYEHEIENEHDQEISSPDKLFENEEGKQDKSTRLEEVEISGDGPSLEIKQEAPVEKEHAKIYFRNVRNWDEWNKLYAYYSKRFGADKICGNGTKYCRAKRCGYINFHKREDMLQGLKYTRWQPREAFRENVNKIMAKDIPQYAAFAVGFENWKIDVIKPVAMKLLNAEKLLLKEQQDRPGICAGWGIVGYESEQKLAEALQTKKYTLRCTNRSLGIALKPYVKQQPQKSKTKKNKPEKSVTTPKAQEKPIAKESQPMTETTINSKQTIKNMMKDKMISQEVGEKWLKELEEEKEKEKDKKKVPKKEELTSESRPADPVPVQQEAKPELNKSQSSSSLTSNSNPSLPSGMSVHAPPFVPGSVKPIVSTSSFNDDKKMDNICPSPPGLGNEPRYSSSMKKANQESGDPSKSYYPNYPLHPTQYYPVPPYFPMVPQFPCPPSQVPVHQLKPQPDPSTFMGGTLSGASGGSNTGNMPYPPGSPSSNSNPGNAAMPPLSMPNVQPFVHPCQSPTPYYVYNPPHSYYPPMWYNTMGSSQ